MCVRVRDLFTTRIMFTRKVRFTEDSPVDVSRHGHGRVINVNTARFHL